MTEFEGINSFLVGMSKRLLREGSRREVRGHVCYELPEPILIKIANPRARLVDIPERKWSPVLPYVESLWLGLGRNDLVMPAAYVSRLADFSDNGKSLRAGYGPRFRSWEAGGSDYQIGQQEDGAKTGVDQFKFIIDVLKRDPTSRQAIISLGDPSRDLYDEFGEIKKTLDRPCTRDIQFMINNGKLDTYVHMRSNDFIWGATGVNIFNFTFMQEIFAGILQVEVGAYYHMANNFHYYKRHQSRLKQIASVTNVVDREHIYETPFRSLEDYDRQLKTLESYEQRLRAGDLREELDGENDFVNDWAKVIFSKYSSGKSPITFANPILNNIINRN